MALNPEQLELLLAYIRSSWQTLRRSNSHLLQAAIDPLFPSDRWIVYVSHQDDLNKIHDRLRQQIPSDELNQITLRRLPLDLTALTEHGLLYLPHDYVIPGTRFEGLYGWDSYWIVLGLLRDREILLARDIVNNFLYEIQHYGMILNANRTYYLTRSHPPFLTQMVLAVFQQTQDRSWLSTTLPSIEQYYAYWMSSPHLTPETGLSRYYDLGKDSAPEVIASERDEEGHTHYERMRSFFRDHPTQDYGYDLTRFYDAEQDCLTPLCFVADRSMRESGFDPSDRFGRFNLGVIDYNPVCLNSLLYLMERDIAEILTILGEHEGVHRWQEHAERRATAINRLMWNEDAGLYFDYDFVHQTQRQYPFLTTFYPLWAGIASRAQAERVVANLSLFEAAGGLKTSTHVSGCQWDGVLGWAPLQMIAVKGLRNYGYKLEADRITSKFLSLVLEEFIRRKAVFEKYDVVNCTSNTSREQEYGYQDNVIGFGWTNGTVLELLADTRGLPEFLNGANSLSNSHQTRLHFFA